MSIISIFLQFFNGIGGTYSILLGKVVRGTFWSRSTLKGQIRYYIIMFANVFEVTKAVLALLIKTKGLLCILHQHLVS